MNCEELARAISDSPLASWSCSADQHFLRLRSPFRYPDGGIIELFVQERGNQLVVTDFGEAYRFLETSGVEPERSVARRDLIELALRLGAARNVEGALEILVDRPTDVLTAVLRLAQVVTRVGDLTLSVKGAFGNTFADYLVEFLKSSVPAAEITAGQTVRGLNGTHRVDIVAKTRQGVSAIEALSSLTPNGANAQTAYTIQKFADIAALGAGAPQRYAVLDDTSDVWSESLRRQLEQFSTVYEWERRDRLVEALRGNGAAPGR